MLHMFDDNARQRAMIAPSCTGGFKMKHLLAAWCLLAAVSVSHAETKDVARADSPAPELASVHAVVADFDTGATLVAKHADAVVPIASLTKLMTAMVVLDAEQPLDAWLKIVPRDKPIEKNAYSRLRIGSEAKRRDLLLIALMSPSVTTSGRPPTRDAITGTSQAMASNAARPNDSCSEGNNSTSAAER